MKTQIKLSTVLTTALAFAISSSSFAQDATKAITTMEDDMTNAVHTLTIAAMHHGLANLAKIMDKTEVHAKAQEIPLENLLRSRLYPDMFSLLQQLQYACFLPVDYARHFSGSEPPRVGYDETTWEDLRKSIDTTAAYLASVPEARLAQDAEKLLPVFFDDTKGLPAVDYAARVLVPDFYFHVAIAYALLRHNGVPLGKSDFLGDAGARPMT